MQEKTKKPAEQLHVRRLKIETHLRGAGLDAKKVPFIRLCGDWLKDCGFAPEGRVTVRAMHGQLIIRVEN